MDKKQSVVLGNLINYCDRHDIWLDYYNGYSESGYNTAEVVLAADWNGPSNYPESLSRDWVNTGSKFVLTDHGKKRKITAQLASFIGEYFEDVEIEWSDEWSSCDECGKAIRTSPNGYDWLPSYTMFNDCEMVCHRCIEEQDMGEDLIEEYKNCDNKAITYDQIDMIQDLGFNCLENITDPDQCKIYQTGFHPGQNDDPKKVAKWIEENLPNHDFIFAITDSGQFDISWSCFVRPVD